MADRAVPHFHNSQGAEAIRIGAREFMCVGALPPFDHPHVFLDMGDEDEVVCPYCSTLYRHEAELAATETQPAGCLFSD
ncbi:MAG TPA: zinc-finger domain-containing protein [Afifellaceae bacterium]|nr:zinc-finger domain-containing protein [Afifellaceae bacterium]